MRHSSNNVNYIDYDLFDAISRRIELRYVGWENGSEIIFDQRY